MDRHEEMSAILATLLLAGTVKSGINQATVKVAFDASELILVESNRRAQERLAKERAPHTYQPRSGFSDIGRCQRCDEAPDHPRHQPERP